MRLVSLVIAILLLAALSAPAALAAGGTVQLSPTAPGLLGATRTATTPSRTATATAPSRTATTAAPTGTATTATTPAGATASPRGDLPYTGDNLLPETVAAVLLVGTGVLIRLRLRRG